MNTGERSQQYKELKKREETMTGREEPTKIMLDVMGSSYSVSHIPIYEFCRIFDNL